MKKLSPVLPLLIVVLALAAGYLGFQYKTSYDSLLQAKAELAAATSTSSTIGEELAKTKEENATLAEALDSEQRRNDAFQERIDSISGTVGKLDKLSKLDPELLQKYSKVYFLNDNYVPSGLLQIPTDWTHGAQEEYFHKDAWPFLEDMLEDAKEDGIELRIVSGYRSFGTQAILKSNYSINYGSGANAFSADQGYSEHQLATTLDFTTDELGSSWSSSFEASEAYEWLLDNAYKYGFVLSYPKDNKFYIFEPWHWRYVGENLARDLQEDGKHFYDLDQREIDSYLIDIFE